MVTQGSDAMEITYSLKYKLSPTESQRQSFKEFAGGRRWVYNQLLEERSTVYKHTGRSVSKTSQINRLTAIKNNCEEVGWLRNIHSQVLQQAARDLDGAFESFFKHKDFNYPRFKSRKDTHQTFRFPQGVKVDNQRVYLPKIGWVRFFKSQPVEGEIKSATVKREAYGWFISINTAQEIEVNWRDTVVREKCVGVDLGLTDFAVLSDGTRIKAPKYYQSKLRKLRREQKKLSRKEYGSNNYQKQRQKVARLHADIANCRQDFLHKLSTTIVRENQAVLVEDLGVKGMLKSRLAKSIGDASWSEFVRMLKYKCKWSGTHFHKVDRFYPSTKTCRHCGHQNDIELSDREFECAGCGKTLDRDLNASINIKNEGLDLLAGGQSDSINASGEKASGAEGSFRVKVICRERGTMRRKESGIRVV